MHRTSKWIVVAVAQLCFIAAVAHADSQNTTVKGLIIERSGATMTVKTPDGQKVDVTLTPNTKIEEPHGAFKMRKKHYDMTALVPGLQVEAKCVPGEDPNKLTADTVKFSGSSLQVANQIQAGLTPDNEALQAQQKEIQGNQQDIAANQQKIAQQQQEIKDVNARFGDLADYNVRDTAVAYFDPGSDKLSEQDKAALLKLAKTAETQTGYIITVKGYTDSTGSAKQNQQLSMDRAENVIDFLEQSGNVPIMHIVAPGAMSTTHAAATNETTQGRAENRRVEVKVLVNKAMAEK